MPLDGHRQMAIEHPIQRLYALLEQFGPYPTGVVPMTRYLRGPGFFPGGDGLANAPVVGPLPRWPLNGVMIVAHNFDCEAGYARSLMSSPSDLARDTSVTRRTLDRLLTEVGIQLEKCFYTNAYVGLKAGTKAMGVFPGSRDPDFVRRCQDFLLAQVQLLQPQLLLSLGGEVLRFLASWESVPDLYHVWAGARTTCELDERGVALVPHVQFPGLPHPTAMVALTHPAIWAPNARRRAFDNKTGTSAERALLQAGVKLCTF